MEDEVVIERIEFLYGHLWQIDFYNKTKNEHYRAFCDKYQLARMQMQARVRGWKNEQERTN